MKIKLTKRWHSGSDWKEAGWTVEVSDADGAAMVADGHMQMPEGTPARKNPEMYALSCNPVIPENQIENIKNKAQSPEHNIVKPKKR
jgi:hypothetical protein